VSKKQKIALIIILLTLSVAVVFLLKSRKEPSAPPFQGKFYTAGNIPSAVSAYYSDTLRLLGDKLKSWDENFLVTHINVTFGATYKELKEMYATNIIKPYAAAWLYSPIHRSTRMYEGIGKEMPKNSHEQDWSMFDGRIKDWPTNKRFPSTDLGRAVEACINYSSQKGSFLLRECDDLIDELGGKRSGWTCEFVSEEKAAKVNYLFEFDFKTEGAYFCSFDSETQEVKNWFKKLLPP